MFFASFTTVVNSSRVRSFLEIAVAKLAFIVRTSRSKCHPIQGDLGVCCFHLLFFAARYSFTVGSCCISSRKVSPAMKVLWLSDRSIDGIPLEAARRLRHMVNEVVVRLSTTSRCTALVVAQREMLNLSTEKIFV